MLSKVWWVGHLTGLGKLRIHTKFLSENVRIGDVLGDVNIDFVDENEVTFQKCFMMFWRDSEAWRQAVMDVVMSLLRREILIQLNIMNFSIILRTGISYKHFIHLLFYKLVFCSLINFKCCFNHAWILCTEGIPSINVGTLTNSHSWRCYVQPSRDT